MDYGTAIFLTDETIGPAHLARLVEERGFTSLFVPEHTHIPVADVAAPERRRGAAAALLALPRPFVALTAAAAATTTLRLGTGVCLLIQRDPITTAKEVATLDLLSGGRFEFGIGAGWNKEEIENHGTDFSRRFGVHARAHGGDDRRSGPTTSRATTANTCRSTTITSWPKPVQRPRPPVLIGGNGEKVLDRVLAYADGWIPNREPRLGERIAELHRASSRGRQAAHARHLLRRRSRCRLRRAADRRRASTRSSSTCRRPTPARWSGRSTRSPS